MSSSKVVNTSQDSNEWAQTPWRKLEKYVFQLQKRIYRARQRGDWSAWRISWVAGLRRWRGHAQRTLLLEKGENIAMHVGIMLAHNHMPVAIFPEQLLVR